MIFYDDLYISEKLEKDKKNIINYIRAGKLYKNIYLIYMNDNTNRPELMHGIFFNHIYMQTKRIKLLGITDTKADGVDFILKYVSGMYDAKYDGAED